MRVLFVTTEPPWPPRGGASLRAYHLLAQTARRHETYLACLATDDQADHVRDHFGNTLAGIIAVPPPAARPMWRRAVETVLSPTPDLAVRCYQPQLAAAVAEACAVHAIHVLHLVGLEAAGAIMGPRWRQPPRVRVVLDELNAEYLLQERARSVGLATPGQWLGAAYSWAQATKLRAYERRACEAATLVLAVSGEDARVLKVLAPSAHVAVVPNGVDVDRYVPAPDPVAGSDVVFTGTMDFRPNVDAVRWFATAVWPLVRAQAPAARFVIAGRNPPAAVRALAAPGVLVTGEVPDDLPVLHQAAVFVVPMRFGGGSRLKLLQALSCGLPVVATTAGAEGVPVEHDHHLLVADSAPDFAAAVVRLLRDRTTAQRLGAAGRTFAQRYRWERIGEALEAAYAALPAAVAQ